MGRILIEKIVYTFFNYFTHTFEILPQAVEHLHVAVFNGGVMGACESCLAKYDEGLMSPLIKVTALQRAEWGVPFMVRLMRTQEHGYSETRKRALGHAWSLMLPP